MKRTAKLRDVAVYLLDRADQYQTSSPCWIALVNAVGNILCGEFEAALDHGEFDAVLYGRVDSIAGRAPARPERKGKRRK